MTRNQWIIFTAGLLWLLFSGINFGIKVDHIRSDAEVFGTYLLIFIAPLVFTWWRFGIFRSIRAWWLRGNQE